MPDVEVKLYLDHIKMKVDKALGLGMVQVALQIEAQTKVNIQENGQIDTGFMLNSTYTLDKDGRQGDTWANGVYESSKTGGSVDRRIVDEPYLGESDAAVVVGAEYAIFQELRNSFLYRAGEQIAGSQAGITLEKVFKEEVV